MQNALAFVSLPAWWANFLLTVVAAASLVFGAALPNIPLLRKHLFEKRLSLLIGFSSGIMLATAIHELIPEAMEHNPARAMTGAAFGFLVLYTAERMTHFHACRHRNCKIEKEAGDAHHAGHHHGEHAHAHSHFDTTALVGMAIHNVADGLTLAAAFSVAPLLGVIVVVAIVLHQGAVGLSLGAIMLKAGRTHRYILQAASITASFIILGFIFFFLAIPVGESSQGIVLGIAGGSFLYVAACDLLPHAHAGDEGWSITASTLAGYAFVLITGLLASGL